MGRLDPVHRHNQRPVEVSRAEELEGVSIGISRKLVAFTLQNKDLKTQILEFSAGSEILSVYARI